MSERFEVLWDVCGFICRKWSYTIGWNMVRESKNKLVGWKALDDTVGTKSVDLKDKIGEDSILSYAA